SGLPDLPPAGAVPFFPGFPVDFAVAAFFGATTGFGTEPSSLNVPCPAPGPPDLSGNLSSTMLVMNLAGSNSGFFSSTSGTVPDPRTYSLTEALRPIGSVKGHSFEKSGQVHL